jgi:hypothetical protein
MVVNTDLSRQVGGSEAHGKQPKTSTIRPPVHVGNAAGPIAYAIRV